MKAIRIMGPGQAAVIDVPEPEPAAGEVVVKVMAVTTCPQWDMHLMRGEPMFAGGRIDYPYTPGQPGHEMAGVIVAVGADVKAFRPGDRVAAWRDPGHHRQGCYAQFVAFDPENLLVLPEGAGFAEYAPFELAMCVGASFLDILGTTGLKGKRVGIAGLGPAGLIAAQYAKAEGAAEVVGFEPSPARAALARRFGVDRTVEPGGDPPGALDVSLDSAGAKPAIEHLMRVTRGIVAIFGVQRAGYVFPPEAGGLKLFGYPGHTKKAADYAMSKVASGLVRLEDLIGARMGLEDYGKAVAALERQEVLKVCFLPNR